MDEKINELLYIELPNLVDRIMKMAVPRKEYDFNKTAYINEIKKVVDIQLQASTTYIDKIKS